MDINLLANTFEDKEAGENQSYISVFVLNFTFLLHDVK